MNVISQIRTAYALGISSIVRVLIYRALVKVKLHPVIWVKSPSSNGPFFEAPNSTSARRINTSRHTVKFLFARDVQSDNHLQMIQSLVRSKEISLSHKHWTKIPDFSDVIGDIKTIWDPNRLAWILPIAQRAELGSNQSIQKLNTKLYQWCGENPPYFGVNWKCGQEASIRVIHLLVGSHLFGQKKMNIPKGLESLVKQHLKRIDLTTAYALAQKNNHIVSEAVALFCGSQVLSPVAIKHQQKGRKLIEFAALRLIQEDGSFSQYSTISSLCIVIFPKSLEITLSTITQFSSISLHLNTAFFAFPVITSSHLNVLPFRQSDLSCVMPL